MKLLLYTGLLVFVCFQVVHSGDGKLPTILGRSLDTKKEKKYEPQGTGAVPELALSSVSGTRAGTGASEEGGRRTSFLDSFRGEYTSIGGTEVDKNSSVGPTAGAQDLKSFLASKSAGGDAQRRTSTMSFGSSMGDSMSKLFLGVSSNSPEKNSK